MPIDSSLIKISVTFRNTESTEALKSYAIEKLTQCVKKYVKDPIDVHVVLSVQKRDHMAEANLHGKNFDGTAKSVSEDLYAAIDKLTDTVDAQLRKQKERTVEHKQPLSY